MAAPTVKMLATYISGHGVHMVPSIATWQYQLYRCLYTQANPLLFHTTHSHAKKTEHQIAAIRHARNKIKLERELRRLNKSKDLMIPVKELRTSEKLRKEADTMRKREVPPLSEEEMKERTELLTEWNQYCHDFTEKEHRLIRMRMAAQQKALDEIRKESEELYQQAISVDEAMYSVRVKPLTDTPPKDGYNCPDGLFENVTVQY